MANHKKEPLRYTVHIELPSEEDCGAIADMLISACMGMSRQQAVRAIRNNVGGQFDYLYGKGSQSAEEFAETFREVQA